MSYQALLFCPDERLARVVTQVFSELDFTVEPVNEPFAAVKKLMAQRYDAVVVDCENEPNATLLFKSARNSSSNQNSLALALVEGQSGVAKAYRIGANLVLTKPINVEQAKGTLRVARGLLRKNVDAGVASPVALPKVAPAPAPAAIPVPPVRRVEAAPAEDDFILPEFETALPAMAASAEPGMIARAIPAPEVKTKVSPEAEAPVRNVLPSSLFEAVQPSSPAAFKNPASGAASAPAPAREIAPPAEIKPMVAPPAEQGAQSSPSFGSATVGSTPSFGALDEQDSEGSGGNKKILVIAAVLIVAAALGFFGWTKLSKNSTPSQSVSTPPTLAVATSPKPVNAAPSPTSVSPASSATPAAALAAASSSSKPSATVSKSSTAISPDEEVVTRKIAPPAIVVKSSTPESIKKTPALTAAPAEDATPQLPNPMALSNPSKNLGGMVSSVPTAMPTAAISTLKISQGVSQGLLIKRIQPRYPQNALSMRMQGMVQLQATIDKEGNISNLKVTSGDAILARAAMEAVKQWRYKPYYLNGEPVEIETQITVNFKLPN